MTAALLLWQAEGEFSDQTLVRTTETVRRFANRLAVTKVRRAEDITAADCVAFIDAVTKHGTPPELTTRHARRVAVRMLFRTWRDIGYAVGDPTLDLDLPPRTGRAARPLTGPEVTLCRAATRLGQAGGTSLQRAVCWALAEATAITSEISAIRVCDIDNPADPRWVELPGTRRTDPRVGELSDWGAVMVKRQLELLSAGGASATTLLTYRGKGTPGQATAQASISNAIAAVLDSAGLADQSDVRPGSVRNWAGRRLFDQGMPLERVARRMGARTLDTCAEDIALDWR
ncbi:hypothetical protein P5P86_19610 [Nocardioides sp. BP30]|uniref:hypothetical protein n=1 Tax=Nocardioides sp. BP30 TaxID=3036374 RepID=UPI0024683ABC|nr:hypothetical protein [Nocardioides sp. BP30]WGL52146.1 hypothetical protein P5P86_19610 [Nocardioides sp. BP30]